MTNCGFHCFHFHDVTFLVISFQTPLKNPAPASGFVPLSLRNRFLRGVIILHCNTVNIIYIIYNVFNSVNVDNPVESE